MSGNYISLFPLLAYFYLKCYIGFMPREKVVQPIAPSKTSLEDSYPRMVLPRAQRWTRILRPVLMRARTLPLLMFLALPAAAQELKIPPDQALKIGKKIWKNEAGGKIEPLTWWNKGEEFASLGIGHFIWYPKDQKEEFDANAAAHAQSKCWQPKDHNREFDESFPKMLAFLIENGVRPPDWLIEKSYCPWNSYEEFMKDFKSHAPRIIELRNFLAKKEIVMLQAQFMAKRVEESLPTMLEKGRPKDPASVRRQFYRVWEVPKDRGHYALMDYVTFKGEGVLCRERYLNPEHGNVREGWGLLQVLEGMTGNDPGQPALDEFARSAAEVLARRANNSPPEIRRWLEVWLRRVETYRTGKN